MVPSTSHRSRAVFRNCPGVCTAVAAGAYAAAYSHGVRITEAIAPHAMVGGCAQPERGGGAETAVGAVSGSAMRLCVPLR